MATDAIIFFKKKNGNYDGVTVNADGYIRITERRFGRNHYTEGLGYTLKNYWDYYEDAERLCAGPTNIRFIDGNDIEYYDHSIDKDIKNISEEKMNSIRQNYCYSYCYEWSDEESDYVWYAGKSSYKKMYILNLFFDDPDEYENSKEWWDTFG